MKNPKTPTEKQLAIFQQARALHHSGQLTAAAAQFGKLLKDFPKEPQLLGELGTIALELGQFAQSEVLLSKALQIEPHEPAILFNRGLALTQLKRLSAAQACYQQCIQLKPDYAEAYYNLAGILKDLHQTEKAIAAYSQAIALKPNFAAAYNDRGLLYQTLQQFDTALADYRQAIALQADYFNAYANYGNALQYLRQFAAALECYERMIALKPDAIKAYFNRGQVLAELKQYPAALASYDNALAIQPDYPYLYGQRLFSKMQSCDWQNIAQEAATLAAKIKNGEKATTPFTVLALIDNPALQRQAAERWTTDKYPASQALAKIARYPEHDQIKLAYFSADFRNHAVAYLTAELFETHDRSRFKIIAFSYGPADQDEMRIRLEAGFDEFIDVQNLSDQAVALLARQLEIDIAVDLGGHTGDSRPGIFALRAAPLQVSYLGYLGTMGADYIDYLLADTVIIPEAAKPHYREKIVYLPSYQVNDSQRRIADTAFSRRQLGLPETGFVYCCFNHTYKINAATFAGWMRILNAVPDSVLLLLADNEAAKLHLQQAAAADGIAAERLVFAERLSAPEYLARYRSADLFLDTLPYNAGTTASDALWAGLPVLTCLGTAFAGRVAASLLTAIDLPELITATPAQYEALAIALAGNPQQLAGIKAKLNQNHLSTALFDSQGFCDHLEDAFSQMYQRYRAGLPTEDIYIVSRR